MGKRFTVLDSFRGIFALFVVAFHIDLPGTITETAFIQNSHIFVEFFFALSGFVLAYVYLNKERLEFRSFFISRTFRLLPLHWAMFGIFVGVEVVKLLAYNRGVLFNTIPFTEHFAFSEMVPNLFLFHALTPLTDNQSFNFPSWSVSIEFYLYLLFFITLMSRRKNLVFIWGGVAIVALGFVVTHTALSFEPILRGLSCFFAGGLTYFIYQKVQEDDVSFVASSFVEIGLILLVVLVVLAEFHLKPLIATGIFCVAILFFAYEKGVVSRILQKGHFQTLGMLSYSIYLIHAPILHILSSCMLVLQKATGYGFMRVVDGRRYMTIGSPMQDNIFVVGIVVVVVALSLITYRCIEVPGQKLGRKVQSLRVGDILPRSLPAPDFWVRAMQRRRLKMAKALTVMMVLGGEKVEK